MGDAVGPMTLGILVVADVQGVGVPRAPVGEQRIAQILGVAEFGQDRNVVVGYGGYFDANGRELATPLVQLN